MGYVDEPTIVVLKNFRLMVIGATLWGAMGIGGLWHYNVTQVRSAHPPPANPYAVLEEAEERIMGAIREVKANRVNLIEQDFATITTLNIQLCKIAETRQAIALIIAEDKHAAGTQVQPATVAERGAAPGDPGPSHHPDDSRLGVRHPDCSDCRHHDLPPPAR